MNQIFFQFYGYDVSYFEFFGMVTGIVAVWLSALANIWSWPIGIINVVLSFFVFYQVQLYPDMFLQIFFFVTNIIGWWRWSHPKPIEEDRKHELKISFMNRNQIFGTVTIAIAGTVALGYFASKLHYMIPLVFTKPSASPYMDSFITVMSIVTTFYMIEKKVECWIIWILIDILATYLYFTRGILLYSVLYGIFTIIAVFALWNWIREYRSYRAYV
ncbi:MAG TPA: nicotinamide riboside transporter PnuC [Chryseosolibacter sp.]|nr:nicotinamide riboside transporter PnuC [Chryseosolibacter sp.]